jgi:DNA-binding transcriptional MocR family regulator
MDNVSKKIIKEIEKRSIKGKLPCPVARKIANDLSVSLKEIGKAADKLNIKISNCELGCF